MKKILPYLGLALLLVPLVAIGAYEDTEAWDINNIQEILSRIADWLYIIGGAVALIVVVVGGIGYMTSGGNEDRQKTAKKTIITGLIGAAIITLAAVIIKTVMGFIGA